MLIYRTTFFVALAGSLFQKSSSSSPSVPTHPSPILSKDFDLSQHQRQQKQNKNFFLASSTNAAFVTSLGGAGPNNVGTRNKIIGKREKRFGVHHHHQRSDDTKCFTMTDDASETTTTTTASSTTYTGGEYSGVYSTHSPLTGKLIPVPDHYVPDAMKEWDMIPAYFEFLLSDDLQQDEIMSIQRRTATILPEVGCGVDNLDVMSTVEVTTLVNQGETNESKEEQSGKIQLFGEDESKVITFDKESSPLHRNGKDLLRKRIETMFYLPTLDNKDDDTEEEKTQQRLRVAFDILPTEGALHDKIVLSLERPFPNGVFGVNKAKSVADLVNGGGLDGRTVSKLIGGDVLDYAKNLRDEEDGEMDGKVTMHDLVGRWKILSGAKEEEVERSVEDWEKMTTIFLPGNIIIRHGSKDSDDKYWHVEVSRIQVAVSEKMQRALIQRTYDVETGFLVNEDSTPEYNTEKKM